MQVWFSTHKKSKAGNSKYGDIFRGLRGSEILKKLWTVPEYRNMMIKMKKEHWKNPEYRTKMEKILKSPEVRLKQSETLKARWKDDTFRANTQKNAFAKLGMKPTMLEEQFMEFFVINNLPFEYVGDGKFLNKYFRIGNKYPDFIHIDGKKLCIEVGSKKEKSVKRKYRTYSSWMEYEQQRKEYFAKRGWKCLVLWIGELKFEQSLIQKVNNFLEE